VKWFGNPWGAPVNETVSRTERPLGVPCASCLVPIADNDNGVLIPTFRKGVGMAMARPVEEPWHIGCFLATVVGPLDVGP
jgi:hypothetical protein